MVLLHGALGVALVVSGFHLVRGAMERPFPFAAAALSSAFFVIHAARQPMLGHEERVDAGNEALQFREVVFAQAIG